MQKVSPPKSASRPRPRQVAERK